MRLTSPPPLLSPVRALVLLALAGLSALASAQAGGTATVLASEDFAQPQYRVLRSTIEFDGTTRVRVQAEGRREGYLIVRDSTPWAVTSLEGQPVVLNFAQMMQTMGGLARNLAPRSLITDGRYVNLTGPGAIETVAGISGRVWQLTTVNKAGRQRSDELVLTSDPKVRELTDAMLATGRLLARSLPELDADDNERLAAELKQRGTGILRVGRSFRLERLDTATPPPSRFALPAEPMVLPDLRSLGDLFGR